MTGRIRKIDIHGAKSAPRSKKTNRGPDSLRSVSIAKRLIAVGERECEGTPTAGQLVPDGKGGQEPRFICNLNLQSKG